jgi:hypothetical protein
LGRRGRKRGIGRGGRERGWWKEKVERFEMKSVKGKSFV